MRRIYEGQDIDVGFDADLCRHSGNCVRGLPAVFDTTRKPWILPDAATADELAEAIGRCPSGALTVERRGSA